MTTSRKNQWSWGGTDDGVKSFEDVHGDADRLRRRRRQRAAERRPDARRRYRPGAGEPHQGDGRVAGEERREHLRHARRPLQAGRATASRPARETPIYVHIRKWVDDSVKLPAIPAKVVSSRVLTGGKAEVRQTDSGIEISVPESDRQPIDTIVALELDGDANQIPAVDVPRPVPLSREGESHGLERLSEQCRVRPRTRPSTAAATPAGRPTPALHQAWLELDLGQPMTFRRARISEAFPNRVQKFELQWLDGTEWKTFCTGTTIGESWSKSFRPGDRPARPAERPRSDRRPDDLGIRALQIAERFKAPNKMRVPLLACPAVLIIVGDSHCWTSQQWHPIS